MKSILVTLPQEVIANRTGGYGRIVREWTMTDEDRYTWAYRFPSRPKLPVSEIEYVLWVIKGRVRWLSMPLYWFTPRGKPNEGGRWLNLTNFEKTPRGNQVRMRGFQGFRYLTQDQEEVLLNF